MICTANVFADIADRAEVAGTLFVRDLLGDYRLATEVEVLGAARHVLDKRVRRGAIFDSPRAVRDFLCVRLGPLEHEVFAVAFVDSQHRLIEFTEMFRGTLTQTSVYPREVVKQALSFNAGALILAHNHPSGSGEPSRADEFLTRTLIDALRLVDVRVLDHMIVAGSTVTSMAERGRL